MTNRRQKSTTPLRTELRDGVLQRVLYVEGQPTLSWEMGNKAALTAWSVVMAAREEKLNDSAR